MRKPDYKQNFKYRMEKYVVGDTAGDIRNIKLSSIILSNIDEPIARQHWASVKSFSNPNVAKTVKSHCKVVIDWAIQNLGIQLPFNPFSFSAPNVVVQRREEIFSDPQVINNQTVINTKKDGEDLLKGPKPPANFLDNHCEEPKFMPALGQHSSEILQEYGFSNEEINKLIDSQIVQGEKIA